MAYHPDDMYLSDELNDAKCLCGPWGNCLAHQNTTRPVKPSPGAKPYELSKLQTFPDDSSFRSIENVSFGFMILLLFNILQFITIGVLVSIILK